MTKNKSLFWTLNYCFKGETVLYRAQGGAHFKKYTNNPSCVSIVVLHIYNYGIGNPGLNIRYAVNYCFPTYDSKLVSIQISSRLSHLPGAFWVIFSKVILYLIGGLLTA